MSKQEQLFLAEISKNAYASISSYTEVKRLPTDEFVIVTHYPLSQAQAMEYEKNGFLKNTHDDIHDNVIFSVKKYQLKNEKNEALHIIEDSFVPSFQRYGLWTYQDILSQNLGLEFKLDQKFKTLTGFIDLEYKLSNQKNMINVPIQISIHDKGLE